MENMVIHESFWRNKNVFLTGHSGFKGGWLSLWLQSMGAKVTGFALKPPTEPNLFDLARVNLGMRSIIGDIRNFEQLKIAFNEANPEIVIHMAAQPLVRYSYDHPIETYSTNVMGTVHLLELIKSSKNVRAVINITSDKCYENKEKIQGYKEDEPMGGFDPYSNSKGCSELVTSAYRLSFFNPEKYNDHGVALASARAGNVIGGGDWAADRLIPDFIRSIVSGKEILIRNPKAIRPWQHVLEPLSGYLILAQLLYEKGSDYAEAWNFGPLNNDAKDVEWISTQFIHYWGDGVNFKIDKQELQPHEAHYLNLDSSKARSRLYWKPKWSTEEAIKRICEWYKAYLNFEDMNLYTLKEISQYQSNLN